jgi:hypothetical protein
MTKTLEDWKSFLFDAIEEVRCAPMLDADRDILVAFVVKEAERIYFGPDTVSQVVTTTTEPSEPVEYEEAENEDAFISLGYRR